MPDWYLLYVASETLGVPPWELGGFRYDDITAMPICWREWALEYTFATAAARQEHMNRGMA